ncbi:MAG: hypothetical protein KF795_16605 [Labilithrix sp.]|nr:hypothetical protein [Labilithrix sp.]
MKRPGKGIVLVALVLGTAAAMACGSSDDDENASSSGAAAGGSDAKKFFVEKVHASVSDSCRECHGTASRGAPVFLGPNAEASYTAIEGFPGLLAAPSFSPIVQKGVHSGPALTQTQSDLATQWLNLEVKARKLGADPGVPKNLRAAFKAFGDCMDFAKWTELKLHTIAAVAAEGNRGQCRSCHATGEASLWLSGGTDNPNDESQNAITFTKFREFPYIQRLVVGRVKDDGTFEDIEPARRLIDKGTEAQQLQANSHPRYSLPSDLVTALSSYVLETISNVKANRCTGISSPDAGLLDASQ